MYRTRCSLPLARNRLSRFAATADGYVTLSRRAMQIGCGLTRCSSHSGERALVEGRAGLAGLAEQGWLPRAPCERSREQHRLALSSICVL